MPTVLRVGRYRFFFFSNEGAEPEHVHIESGDEYAKFWIEPVGLARSVGYSASELNVIERLVEKHKDLIKEKWDEYFGH